MIGERKPGWFGRIRGELKRLEDYYFDWPSDAPRNEVITKIQQYKERERIIDRLRFLKDSTTLGGSMADIAKRLNEEAHDPKRETNMEALLLHAYAAFLLREIGELHAELTETQA